MELIPVQYIIEVEGFDIHIQKMGAHGSWYWAVYEIVMENYCGTILRAYNYDRRDFSSLSLDEAHSKQFATHSEALDEAHSKQFATHSEALDAALKFTEAVRLADSNKSKSDTPEAYTLD